MRRCCTIVNGNYLIGLIIIVLSLFKTEFAFGAEEPYVNALRGTGVVKGAKFDVTDEKFLSSGLFYGTIRPAPFSLTPENIVELKLNYDTTTFFYDKVFTATVNVTILCYNNPYDTSQVFTQYNNINLTIKHDTATWDPYKGVYFMKFSGAYKFRVVINSITCPELGTNLPPVLIVEGKTVIKRKYNFSTTTSDITKIEELPKQFRLSWIPANYAGAELFDLEYTVVDSSSTAGLAVGSYLSAGTPIPQAFMEGLFRNNASRITTSASNYTLNPLYQSGYLLFRIRGVQFANEYQTNLTAAEQNLRTEGNWNYLASKLNQPAYKYNVVRLEWHERNLNWQYNISFAEEGKRKEVIGYFDGIFKNRQNVTLNNSDNKSVVQETIYDALGRAAINVLPVPVNDQTIHYFHNFNRNKLGKTYSYKDFAFGATCRTIPETMAETSGANQYYSANNNINDYFFKKYIPQAEGYPFSVTEYTADNTGRIFAQGGVGKDFQPGSNHETKYYYSKPTQEELDRLFGSEAGNASHHLKNMVVDPNGQISVSYLNAGGKTIATALAGLTPNNVEAISSNDGTGTDVTKNLLMPQDFTKDYSAGILLGNSSFLAAVSGNYKFNYDLTPLRLDVLHGANNQFKICNTCYYDLEITVKDNCSQVLKTVSRPVDPNTVFQTDCNISPAVISDNFSIDIYNIGEYSVSYLLKVSEKALGYYDSVHLVQNTNLRSFNSFAIEKLKNGDFKDCFSECTTCLKELGTKTDFVNNKIKPLFIQADSMVYVPEFDVWANSLYDSLLANCNSIQPGCTVQAAPCDEEKQLLLNDVKPGGQYATYDASYKPTEVLTNVMRNYRKTVSFLNEDGSPGMIEWKGMLYPANDTINVPWKAFIENFRDSWAEALLPYHPEYCFYQWCAYGNNPASKAFDNTIMDIEDDSTATAKGYFGSVTSLLTSDPFFSSSGNGYAFYSKMQDSLNLFSRTIPGYSGPDYNIRQYIDYELYCEEANILPGNCTFPAPNASCRSPYIEWQLYRDYYLNLKAYFNEKARLANPIFANCRNCYIGTDYTDFFTCKAPPSTDFSVDFDTVSMRLTVKYKKAEAAVSNKLKITFNYNSGTFTQTFRAGRSTEIYTVPASVNNYYAVTQVQCDTASGGQTSMVQPFEQTKDAPVKFNATVQTIDQPGLLAVGCPCPTYSLFKEELGTGSCPGGGTKLKVTYSGPTIPPGRTVYVDVYWFDYISYNSGIATFTFTNTVKVVNVCVNGMDLMNQVSGDNLGINKEKIPTPETLSKIQPVLDSLAKINQSSDSSFMRSKLMATTEGLTSYYIQAVYCYDAPGFICSETVAEPVSLCKDDPLSPYYKDKIRRYDGYQNPQGFYQNLTTNYSKYQSLSQSDYYSDCYANCEAQADVWMSSLKKCTTDANILAAIKAGLIAVCQSGCDPDHPYGASSNSSLTQSFESVIRQYIPNSTDYCTAELISDPYPYNRQPSFDNRTLIKIDDCLTTRFSQLKSQYLSSGYVGSFHQWLQKQLKNDYQLTQQQLTDLEASINGGCKYLKRPLLLPVAFNCSGAISACADSATTMQTYSAFLAKYPGLATTNANYEILLTNYFNHTLAFNLGFEDYQSYIGKCQTGTTNKDLLCNKALSSQLIVKEDLMQCMTGVFNLAIAQAVNEYTLYIDSIRTAFRNSYIGKCLNAAAKLTMNAKLYEYHYTLYYYDQSGNLVKTIPPEGVKLLTNAQVSQVSSNRLNTNGYCYTGSPELTFNGNIMTMNREPAYDAVVDGKYSLEAWIKLGNLNLTGPNGIFSYNDIVYSTVEGGYALLLRNSKLFFTVGTTPKLQVETPVLSTFLSANAWFHIVITVNNVSNKPVKMYINGNNVPLTYLNNNPAFFAISSGNPHKLRIGAAFDNNAITSISGSGLKQFRWYQRELGTAEIQQNAYNSCFTPASETGLISYIPVNEGAGTVLNDKITGNMSVISGSSTTAWQNFSSELYPKHQFATTYQYNSYNQVVRQNSPDGGTSTFWYDNLGRLAASQNSEQKLPKNTANTSANRYSYTRYDAIGRINEVGEKYSGLTLIFDGEGGTVDSKNISALAVWYSSGTDKQVTSTIYDEPNTSIVTNTNITGLQNTNMRKRVVSTIFKEQKTNPGYDFASHYVYDINGNVKTLFQESALLKTVEGALAGGIRQINYDYDLVSGKVNKLIYQPGKGDQFIYRYDYDADNRLTDAYTSRNGLQWQRDAHYYYYLHGPLARVELGKYQVQGIDYAYTLQGWLKGINSQSLNVTKDMAGDGDPASAAYKKFGRDVYGYSLGYHGNDYKPIGGATANAFDLGFTAPATAVAATGAQLFNGNISNTTVALSKINGGQTTGYSYLYDQLNRLLGTLHHSISGPSWSYNISDSVYKEKISYDANGNIKTYLRRGSNKGPMPLEMDNLKYFYYYTNTGNTRSEYDPTQPLPADVKMLTNQLAHISDSDPADNYAVDIDNQNSGNYDYDNSGNLIKDNAEGITGIEWNVYGKIKQVVKNGATISYQYDAAGNRVMKQVGNKKDFYIRDAQGNVMAIYKDQGSYVDWTEQHLYGSSRLGIWNYGKKTPDAPGAVVYDSMMVGSVNYELSNHLGNVLSTISDKKIGISAGKTVVDYYSAVVTTQNDYYPFGMQMPGRGGSLTAGGWVNGTGGASLLADLTVSSRTGNEPREYKASKSIEFIAGFSSGVNDEFSAYIDESAPSGGGGSGAGEGAYRYGFNGKEDDKETNNITTYDYGFRIYSPALGRFLSVDPLTKKYPSLTPYQFASNSPIAGVDLDGLEFYFAADGSYLGQSKNGGTQIRIATEYHANPNDKSQLIFTKYKEIDNIDASIAGKVYATIYKREVKNPHSPNVSASEETSGGAFAGTDPENKHITIYFKKSMSSDDGTRQKLMTDYYNAASTLNHEDDHAGGLTSNGFDHFRIGEREATNRFQSKVSKYYKENLISNMRSYLRDQVDAIISFRNKGYKESEGYYRKEYEKNLKTFNRLFGENDKSFFKVLEEKTKTNKPESNS